MRASLCSNTDCISASMCNYSLIAKRLNHTSAAPHYLYLHSPNCASSLPPGQLFFGTRWICAASSSCPSPAETCLPLCLSSGLPAATREQLWRGRNKPSIDVSNDDHRSKYCDFIMCRCKECLNKWLQHITSSSSSFVSFSILVSEVLGRTEVEVRCEIIN